MKIRLVLGLTTVLATNPVLAISVNVDHSKLSQGGGSTIASTLPVRDGDDLTVKIGTTCSKRFSFSANGLSDTGETVKDRSTSAMAALAGNPLQSCMAEVTKQIVEETCVVDSKTVTISVDDQFAGYEVSIGLPANSGQEMLLGIDSSPSLDQLVEACSAASNASDAAFSKLTKGARKLKPVNFVIPVETQTWELAFSGGFYVSDLVSPRYSISQSADGENVGNVIVRDAAREDDYDLGFLGLMHITHPRLYLPGPGSFPDIPLALTAGLGSAESDSLSIFGGVSTAFGDKGYLTLGYHWGKVDALPGGATVGSPTDLTSLELGERTEGAVFLSFTYSFAAPDRSFLTSQIAPAE